MQTLTFNQSIKFASSVQKTYKHKRY